MGNIKHILSGEIFQNKLLKKNIKYITLVFSLFFVFILIGAVGAFKIGQIQELKKDILEQKEESIYLSSELMQLSLNNEVDKQVQLRNIGLQKLSKPPKIIEIKIDK